MHCSYLLLPGLILACPALLKTQNLVPNFSFESLEDAPNMWMLNDTHFHAFMKDWNSPTEGSPDIFHNRIKDKFRHERPNVDMLPYRPRSGFVMTGIKGYGCKSGTMHCKEYLQVELLKPMVPGKRYSVSFWVNPIATSVRINNWGAAFSTKAKRALTVLNLGGIVPSIHTDTIVYGRKPSDWSRIAGTFVADSVYTHLLIGNFFSDEETRAMPVPNGLRYAYYLVDDVIVRPFKNGEPPKDDWSSITLGIAYELPLALFQFDRAELDPEALPGLEELAYFLKYRPDLKATILGHTDPAGTELYNLKLSEARANAVAAYLQVNGVPGHNLQCMGLGASRPRADNSTEEGRRLNRRVEVVIGRVTDNTEDSKEN